MTQYVIQPAFPATPSNRRRGGFTLIELLVTISIIAMLLSILLPALGSARETSQSAVCLSNIRQLAIANAAYAQDNDGFYVPAAEDIFDPAGNTKRWHGRRASANTGTLEDRTFKPTQGPLADYLGHTGEVRFCPTFNDLIDHDTPGAFEVGTGGYGYNRAYLGGRNDLFGTNDKAARHTARTADPKSPTQTVMFTDAAFFKIVAGQNNMIEYSFAEPPFIQSFPGPPSTDRWAPSIHFRHQQKTHVAWADGHANAHAMTFTHDQFEDFYRKLNLGWFGPESNELFDLQ